MSGCIMGRVPTTAGRCSCAPKECRTCGFDRDVAAKRIARIRAGEMTVNKHGNARLILDKETGI